MSITLESNVMSVLSPLFVRGQVGWLVVLRIYVDLAIFQRYLDLESGDNQSLKIQAARPGIEPRSSFSASQELNHSATATPMFEDKSFHENTSLYFINILHCI